MYDLWLVQDGQPLYQEYPALSSVCVCDQLCLQAGNKVCGGRSSLQKKLELAFLRMQWRSMRTVVAHHLSDGTRPCRHEVV